MPPLAISALFLGELVFLAFASRRATALLLAFWHRGTFPFRFLVTLTIAPGVVVHELSHALACLATGAGIRRLTLFSVVDDGRGAVRLGSVEPRYRPAVPGGALLIGVAPILLGATLIELLSRFLLEERSETSPLDLFAVLVGPPYGAGDFLWIWLSLSIAISLFPSSADFAVSGLPGALGAAAIVALPALLELVSAEVGGRVGEYHLSLMSALLVPTVLSVALWLALSLLFGHRRARRP
jgi:hypothetical protein